MITTLILTRSREKLLAVRPIFCVIILDRADVTLFERFSIISSINLDVIFHGEFCDMKQTVMQKRRHPWKNKYYANSKVCAITFSLVFCNQILAPQEMYIDNFTKKFFIQNFFLKLL